MLSIVGVVDFLSSGKLGLALQQILWRLRRLGGLGREVGRASSRVLLGEPAFIRSQKRPLPC
jgi:hypothetical protein